MLWSNNQYLFNEIKNKFDIVDTFIFKLNKHQKYIILNKLYHPFKISKSDLRINLEDIKIIVIKIIDPIYKISSRNIHKNKPLNQTIIKFKEKLREKYRSRIFHSADYINEAEDVFKFFRINKYITNKSFINIKDLRGQVRINTNNNFLFLKIEDTPHYLYLNKNKKPYIEFTNKISRTHTTKKYDELINDINTQEFCLNNINNVTINVKYNKKLNKYIILDGLHRASIFLNNNVHYIKCKIIN